MKWLLLILSFELVIYGNQQLGYSKIKPVRKYQVESVHPIRTQPAPVSESLTGLASFYNRSACDTRIYGVNCKTADGEIFDETKFTAACAGSFHLGDNVRICYLDHCITVKCNDRGGFAKYGRSFDLTPLAFNSLADSNLGVIKVEYKVVK